MSFTAAISEVQSQLVASGLTEYGDPRADSLLTAGGGKLDSTYLLRPETVGEPWIEAWNTPKVWFAKMRVEVAKMLGNDELDDVIALDTLVRAVQKNLLHTSLVDVTVFDSQEAKYKRNAKDRRLVWEWRFSIRYVE